MEEARPTPKGLGSIALVGRGRNFSPCGLDETEALPPKLRPTAAASKQQAYSLDRAKPAASFVPAGVGYGRLRYFVGSSQGGADFARGSVENHSNSPLCRVTGKPPFGSGEVAERRHEEP